MKKIILIGALMMCMNVAFSQSSSFTKEELKYACASFMWEFTEGVTPYFKQGMSLAEFQDNLLGKSVPTEPGKGLIAAAFQLLINKADKEMVLGSYTGVEVADCFKYSRELELKTESFDGSAIFGLQPDAPDEHAREGKCRWYQINCLLNHLATKLILLFTPPFMIYPFLI